MAEPKQTGFRTLSREVEGDHVIAHVTLGYPDGSVSPSWEFYCGACDTLDVGYTEAEAREAAAEHVCLPDEAGA